MGNFSFIRFDQTTKIHSSFCWFLLLLLLFNSSSLLWQMYTDTISSITSRAQNITNMDKNFKVGDGYNMYTSLIETWIYVRVFECVWFSNPLTLCNILHATDEIFNTNNNVIFMHIVYNWEYIHNKVKYTLCSS